MRGQLGQGTRRGNVSGSGPSTSAGIKGNR